MGNKASIIERPQCACWLEMIRVYSAISRLPQPQNASLGPPLPTMGRVSTLIGALVSSQGLVNLWTNINGCPNSELHLGSPALKFLTDSISRLVPILAAAIADMGDIGEDMVMGEMERALLACFLVIQVAIRHAIIQLSQILVGIEGGVIQRPNTDERVRPLHNLEISALTRRMVALMENVQAWGVTQGRTTAITGSGELLR
ncbi:hypothetical protein DL546_000277 [Coniochaeta pulveracea]|uniref:Uncharacterized protein n=1 Tax=Coniochaeta pulveracea TaxID=177199 RepID=A0A420XW05_9PEZI|nr:hypothetical protein DL546_000277 [Coniochaeta pulveracea]